MHGTEAGTLDAGHQVRSGGKAVDEWTFRSPFRDKNAPKLSAKIYIDKSNRKEFKFVAQSDSLPRPIEDTDINRLKQKVDEALRFQHDMLTGVTWEDWLEIRVNGRYRPLDVTRQVEADLTITYRVLKRGVHPKTGEAYVINSNGIATPFPKPKKAGELDEGADEDRSLANMRFDLRQREYEYSYLPSTPENIAALEDLMARMQKLRENLAAFLRQDTVQQSLANLANQSLALPAPL